MPTQAAPIAASERILTLDVIRGVALLGIFIMNMPYFGTSFFAGADATHLFPAWWDRAAETARDVLFSGKFNSMFSMLFAVGFTIQLGRLEQRDPDHAKSIYLRRIFWLFVFGVIHATVFWTGDVLHMFAVFGLALLVLRRVSDRVLWTLFVAALLYPVVLGAYRVLTTTPEQVQAFIATSQAWEATNNAAYGSGSFLAAVREHTREMVYYYANLRPLLRTLAGYAQLFATMLIGLWLARRNFFQNTGAYLPLVRRAQWWALAVGALTGAVFGYYIATVEDPTPTPFALVARTCYFVCRIAITVFYVAIIVRAMHDDVWRRRLAPLAAAGRMPLSNYLLQTLIATFFFYGWGLGFWGKVGPALGLVLAVGIFFLVQVPLSKLWLRHFEQGPMEYLWRVLTYGRTPLKRAAIVAS